MPKGSYIRTPEIRARNSEGIKALGWKGENSPNFGRKHSESTRQLMSDQKKDLMRNGWMPWNTGKKVTYSPEHLAKLQNNIRLAIKSKHKYKDGFRVANASGYLLVYAPDHPSANSVGYVHQQRMKAEAALGRPMRRSEVVHHIDGNKQNNENGNLLICSCAYHAWLHARMANIFQQAMFGKEVQP